MKALLFILIISISTSSFSQVDVLHYKFEIELSDASDAITGKATITVRFTNDASQVRFDLASTDNDKGMYAFEVKEKNAVLKSNHLNDLLLIDLNKKAINGEEKTFEISYMGTPKDGLIISKNKFGDRTFFGDNWPNRAHQWIPCHDDPNDKASFEFLITAPKQYRVISNGDFVMQKEDVIRNQQLANLGKICWHWKEDTPLSTKIMVIGVAKFAAKEFSDSPSGIPVTAWVYKQDSSKGFYDYGLAPSIVKFFSNYIAPFPYKKLANVQSTTIFGGMENAGAIFYAEESVTGDRKWEEVIAHEIAHQWFGDMASEKSFAHLWLSEGFATYLTNYYMEKKYGKDSANKRLEKERRQVIQFAKGNHHAVVDSTTDLMSLLNANSYQKGGWVLHMLRQEVGDTVFQKILQGYYQQYKGGNAETRDFEMVAEKVSGKNLKWFFDQWLYREGIPKLSVTWKYSPEKTGGHVEMNIKQTALKTYKLPLTIEYVFEDGSSETKKLGLANSEEQATFIVAKKPVKIILDPGIQLLFDGSISEMK